MMIDRTRIIFDRLLGTEEEEADDEPHEGLQLDGKRKRDRKHDRRRDRK